MSTKRRVAAAASPELSVHGQKRRKVSDDSSADAETPQTTTEAGLKLLAHIKQSTDKNGRQIATSFLHLPDRKENPDYYRAITLPIAIDTVEDKLKRHQYPTVTALESDLKRMISNAKFYNQKSSLVFADAERIRKILSNNMPKINPAYKDPKYVAFPTPLPEEASPDSEGEGKNPASSKASPDEPQKSRLRSGSRSAVEKNNHPPISFEGDSLQSAQDKIISELINLKDPDGKEVGLPFVNKPDRNLYKDYYEIIQHPVSLRAIQKQVRGTDGRKAGARTTAFPTWQSFEEETEYIWRNAREFNEDGSEVFVFAGILEEYFKRCVAEARRVVPDEAQEDTDGSTPRLRLRMAATKTPEPPSQRLTLRLPGQKLDNTSKDEKTQPGMTVDSEALKRQQELVRAGSNGKEFDVRSTPLTRSLRRTTGSPKLGVGKFQIPQENRGSNSAISPARSTTAAVKSETQATVSPKLAAVRSREDSQESVHPTAGPAAVPPSTGPSVSLPLGLTPSNVSGSPAHHIGQIVDLHLPQNVSFDNSIWGKQDRSSINALFKNVSIFTHPTLDLPKALNLDISPSTIALQQSITINLPSTHNYLLVRPTTTEETPQRHIKLVASVGTQKIPLPVHTGLPESTSPVYELRLNRGVTRVDLEIIAGPSRTVSRSGPPGSEIEYERLTIFFHLMRP